MEPATANQVGAWLLGLVGVLSIVLLALTIFNQFKQATRKRRPRPVNARAVTRSEMLAMEAALKAEMQRVETDVKAELAKQENYSRTRLHELADAVHEVAMKQATIPVLIREHIDKAVAPIASKVDQVNSAVIALSVKLDNGWKKANLQENEP